MTVSSTASTVNYQGNGATTVFPFTFYVSNQNYLVVQIVDNSVTPATTTTLTPAQYSVTGIGNAAGGSVTYSPAIPSTKRIVISRVLPYTQTTALNNQDGFFPAVVEGALDYLTYLTQQLAAQYSNLNITTGNVPAPTLPQVGYVLTATGVGGFGWAASGAPDLSIYMQKANNLSDVSSVATARANLGLGTAAQFNIGTGANQVVQLDSNSKLPAVDGSQLTNLPALSTTGVLVGIQVFTANGTYTRSANVTNVYVICQAAGGGAQSKGSTAAPWSTGSGGGGECRVGVFTPSATETVTVGQGVSSGTGGSSSFGAFISSTGGATGTNTAGGNPGTGGSGGFRLPSGAGSLPAGSGSAFGTQVGGSSPFGGGYAQNVSSGQNNGVYGTGAAGACLAVGTTSGAAAAGSNGVVIVYEYK